ncbi:hypothetical protein E2C01_068560 [Portunus trituberculatus]|uniref:Uncharacterized protein n=1 Tax=Portunus trituberculatus TaxID=210409 RepID=A0A5B7HZS4_PORTR|nr:hypothetical protein [Portunus trituberculatus]
MKSKFEAEEKAGGCGRFVYTGREEAGGRAAVSSVAGLEWTLDTRVLFGLPGDTHSFVGLCLVSR